jgi:CHAD domain-containing protein
MTYQLRDSISTVLHTLGNTLLNDAISTAARLDTPKDTEALHDFRVSVRRLRSFLKSYEDDIKSAKKHRQRLSDVMALTTIGRDTEVHIAWLKAHHPKSNEQEQTGISYLLEYLTTSDPVDIKKIDKHFAKAVDKLGSIFSSKSNATLESKKVSKSSSDTQTDLTDLDAKDSVLREPSFAFITAKVLQDYGKDLRDLLQKIGAADDDTSLHKARIAGKRLRYTLELLEGKEASTLVKVLKKFQDTTGDLHDLQMLEPKIQTLLFAETVLWSQAFRDGSKTLAHTELSQLPELQRCYGLAAVQRKLGKEKTTLHKNLQGNWLSTTGEGFFKDLDILIRHLAEPDQAKLE